MKRKILFLLFISILLLTNVSAYYSWSHRYWDLKAITETDSPITQECGQANLIALCLDSESSMDIPVLHYSDNKLSSYIFTHVKNAITEGLDEAGSDLDLRCQAYCSGLHLVQDHFSHDEEGLVPKYLEKSFAPNLGGHMTIENDFDKKHKIYVRDVLKDPLYERANYYDTVYLDTFFEDEKYILQLNEIAGIDLRNDLNVIANGYKGTGFKATVYDQKLKLPWWFWAVGIGGTILGVGLMLLILITGKTKWKWISILPWLLVGVAGGIVLIAFFTNSSWQIVNSLLRIPTSVGLLSVSQADVEYYDKVTLEAAKLYLQTGVMPYDDSSGLSYVSKEGKSVQGALTGAGRRFTYILLPILVIFFVVLNMLLFIKTYSIKKSPGVTKMMYLTLISFVVVMIILVVLGKWVL